MTKAEQFKSRLARVFDSNLHTRQWENYVDYVIIGLIIISTLSLFIATFEISPLCEKVLQIIDCVTVATFTIEVSLRIWAADLIDEKYKGFWGRVRYCFSFYGLVDILSTYTFYLSLFIPGLNYQLLKSLRVLRLLRIFRYMRSFRMVQQALSSKSKEQVQCDDPKLIREWIEQAKATYEWPMSRVQIKKTVFGDIGGVKNDGKQQADLQAAINLGYLEESTLKSGGHPMLQPPEDLPF